MMKKVLCIALFVLFALGASAQPYRWAAGIKAGGGSALAGLTVKHFFDAHSSIDGVVSIPYDKGFNVLALYQRNVPVITEGFNFYYGAGANLGAWKNDDVSKFVLGIDLVVGLEYKLKPAPIAFSLDYIPGVNIIGHTGFFWGGIGLGIKYTF